MEFLVFLWFVAVIYYNGRKYLRKRNKTIAVKNNFQKEVVFDELAELFARANALPATPRGVELREKLFYSLGSLSWDSRTPNRSHPDFGRIAVLQQVVPGRGFCFVLKLKRTIHTVTVPYTAELASQFKLV